MAETTVNLVSKNQEQPSKAGEKSIATREESRYIVPPADIYETGDALTVVVDLPGVDKKDVDIRVEDNTLTIRGKAGYDPPKNLLREEFNLSGYFRQFLLSEEVDQGKIMAETKHGVLVIRLPKAEKTKPRQIQVKLG